MHLFLRACFLCLLFSFLTSCTSLEYYKEKASPRSASKKIRKSFSVIQTQMKRRGYEKSLQDLNRFISRNRNSELLLAAYLLKAQILERQRADKKACETYYTAVNLPYYYKNQYKAYFASAKCFKKEKKLKSAIITLEYLIQSPKESTRTKRKASRIQWTYLKNESGLVSWKLKSLSHIIKFHPNDSRKSDKIQAGWTLINQANSYLLLKLAEQAEQYDSFEGYILYRTGIHFWEKKDLKKSREYFTQALSSPLNPKIQKELQHYIHILTSLKKTNPYLIGVVLPLSGPGKKIGQKILRGLHIGFGLGQNSPWQLIIMDSKGHPDVAKESVEKLLYKHNVIGLIGGVTNQTAEKISEASSQFGIPSILFSQKSNLTESNPFVFQNAITSDALINQLISTLSKKSLDIKKVAILTSKDSYGKEYAQLFSEVFEKQGGEIVGIETYAPNEVDFNIPLKKLFKLHDLKEREEEYEKLKKKYLKKHSFLSKRSKKLNPEKLLKPQVDFDAIFIPDSFNNLKKINAHLKYYNIKDIYLLGTNLWSKDKISNWPEHRPLIFVNTPPITNELIKKSFFLKKYKKVFLSYPKFFEQQAYNAAIAFKQALQKNARNRLALQRELKKLGVVQGALYPFKISENRTFIHPLSVFMTDKDEVLILDSIPVK